MLPLRAGLSDCGDPAAASRAAEVTGDCDAGPAGMEAGAAPDALPLDFPRFVPRAPWWGGDLQTLRNFFVRRVDRLAAFALRRLELPLGDGSGARLSAVLHLPAGKPARPLAVLIHGLSGSEASLYVLRSAGVLLAAGFPVLRLNLRGAGPSRPLCAGQYHAGRSADLGAALAALPAALVRHGLVAIGYSLGANLLLKFLGEGGDARLRGAAAVSAPIDLIASSRRLKAARNAIYQRYLLAHMKHESLQPAAALTVGERRVIAEARSVFEFDDRFVAPRNGFVGAEDYYARSSAQRVLDAIRTPTLVIHALDDPWIPAGAYLARDWRANRNLVPLLPARGGHVGFQGIDRRAPWHDLCTLRFFESLVA